MPGLQIQPHSRQVTGYAVAGLMLLSAGSFAAGLSREVAGQSGPSPFGAPQASYAQASTLPEATPAPDPRVATAPPPKPAAEPAPPALDVPAAPAETPPALDASATAPEPSPAPTPTPDETNTAPT